MESEKNSKTGGLTLCVLVGKRTKVIEKRKLRGRRNEMKIVAVSGGFDPPHPGHIDYIEEAITLGDKLIVILTRDDQLLEKDRQSEFPKNRKPLLYEVRKAILEWGLKGRGKVVENIDKDITVQESLRKYKPDIFAKGGDSWNSGNLPEQKICEELGIEIVFGVGGFNKPYSSSKLMRGKLNKKGG